MTTKVEVYEMADNDEPTHEMVVSTIGGDEFCIPIRREDWSTLQVARDVALRCKGDAAALYGMTESTSPHGHIGVAIPIHAVLTVLVRRRKRAEADEPDEAGQPAEAEQEPAEQAPMQADAQLDAAASAAAADVGEHDTARFTAADAPTEEN